ncbi:MAG: N-acetylmuramoyl-L-alanine amidase [Eubacteriales bacterium]
MKIQRKYLWIAFAILMIVIRLACDDEEISSIDLEAIEEENQEVVEEASKGRIVIDPGHGGADPGKVGINGALEKNINLVVSLLIREELQDRGYEVIMTREEDTGTLADEAFNKEADLAARVETVNESEPDLVVSIHQNSYTSESVKGPQVFYYSNSVEGQMAAQIIQEELWELDPDSIRQIAENDSYYLLTRTSYTTVIVECGFLSNTSDAQKLIDPTYQQQLAETIVDGIERYLSQ